VHQISIEKHDLIIQVFGLLEIVESLGEKSFCSLKTGFENEEKTEFFLRITGLKYKGVTTSSHPGLEGLINTPTQHGFLSRLSDRLSQSHTQASQDKVHRILPIVFIQPLPCTLPT
jgi:hypothetical protein